MTLWPAAAVDVRVDLSFDKKVQRVLRHLNLNYILDSYNFRMKFFLLTLLYVLDLSLTKAHSVWKEDCYANNSHPYLLFATKTSYFTVDNEEINPIEVEGKTCMHFLVQNDHFKAFNF